MLVILYQVLSSNDDVWTQIELCCLLPEVPEIGLPGERIVQATHECIKMVPVLTPLHHALTELAIFP